MFSRGLEMDDSEISTICKNLAGTREAEIIGQMEKAYESISGLQGQWYKESQFFCPEGCGECCRNFEPDLLESEALFMAAWIMENQPEIAEKLVNNEFPFPRGKGCQFWNENATYHCSIYGGRPLICRLFGACGNRSKDGGTVWKPCKFYSSEKLAEHKPPLSHRQYSREEIISIFGTLPPVMSNMSESVVSLNPDDSETKFIRDALPDTIKRLLWISSMNQ